MRNGASSIQRCLPVLHHKSISCATSTSQGCHSQCIIEKFSRVHIAGRHSSTPVIPTLRWRILDSAVCVIDEVRLTWNNNKAEGEKPYRWKDLEVHGLGLYAVYTHHTGTRYRHAGANRYEEFRTESLALSKFKLPTLQCALHFKKLCPTVHLPRT